MACTSGETHKGRRISRISAIEHFRHFWNRNVCSLTQRTVIHYLYTHRSRKKTYYTCTFHRSTTFSPSCPLLHTRPSAPSNKRYYKAANGSYVRLSSERRSEIATSTLTANIQAGFTRMFPCLTGLLEAKERREMVSAPRLSPPFYRKSHRLFNSCILDSERLAVYRLARLDSGISIQNSSSLS